jgi:hypothetical protein
MVMFRKSNYFHINRATQTAKNTINLNVKFTLEVLIGVLFAPNSKFYLAIKRQIRSPGSEGHF